VSVFTEHTIESAPPGARRSMTAMVKELGFLPAAIALLANSPETLDAFRWLLGSFDGTTLEPLARETVIMTIATRNGCHLCMAVHTARLTALGASPDLIAALRSADGGGGSVTPDGAPPSASPSASSSGASLGDPRLDAIRAFTLRVLDTAGDVGDEAMRAFLDAGYTTRNALEVVLGIATYTLSTFANRLTGAPIDPQFAAFA
jgi:AhpD family alkylhydroperoxidase